MRRVLIALEGTALTTSDNVTLTYTSVRSDRHLPNAGIRALATPSPTTIYYANNLKDLRVRNGLED